MPKDDLIQKVKEYLTDHKQAYDPRMMNMAATTGLGKFFQDFTVTPAQEFITTLPCDDELL